jgi:hypothetical protein
LLDRFAAQAAAEALLAGPDAPTRFFSRQNMITIGCSPRCTVPIPPARP